MIMRHLRIFDTVRVISGEENSKREIEGVKHAGFMTLSQSGEMQNLIDGIIEAT